MFAQYNPNAPITEDDVIGCANLRIGYGECHIHYIEACNGNGANILNYIINKYNPEWISGESYEDLLGFWNKMGAIYTGIDYDPGVEYDPTDLYDFEITREDFMKTKYYTQ